MNTDARRDSATRLLRDAIVTLGVVLISWGAFDDITTDDATTFTVEYAFLAASAIWLLILAMRLLRLHHQALGVVSFVLLGGAIWGQRAIHPGGGDVPWPQYVAVMAAFAWFLALSGILLVLGWRMHPQRHAGALPPLARGR